MLVYVIRRLVMAVLLAWLIVTLVFFLLRLIPGDVVQILLREGSASPELVQARREALGLDRPWGEQYIRWLIDLARLDLGTSLATQRPILPDVAQALPRTLELISTALALAFLIGIPVGVLAASHRGGTLDVAVMTGTLLGISVPDFVIGTVMVLTFGLILHWFPTAGYVAFSEGVLAHIQYLVMPATTLAMGLVAIFGRFTRSAMLDVLAQDYVRTAAAKGLSSRKIRYRHALKNALIPIVTVVGLEGGSLLGGTVIVEFIFNWPGMSTLLIQSVTTRDYTLVQAVVVVIATLFLILNLTVDLINAYVDPRIRYG